MRFIHILLACSVIIFTGCNNQTFTKTGSNNPEAAKLKEPVSSKLDNTGTTLIMQVVAKYYGLKNALVATKAAQADSAALQLVTVADVLHRYTETDTAHGAALKPFVDTILMESKIIPGINDESCERQRLAFGPISSAIYGLVKAAGLKNAGIFQEYCPMAFNEKGATWLSDESEIKNPYFGKKMMECGEVTDSL